MSRTTKQTYVYWIHLPEHTDIMTQGYIGVSNNPGRRLYEHKNDVKNNDHINPILANAIKKYSKQIIQTIIFSDSQSACYKFEEFIRPAANIGWNINKGGECPPTWEGKKLTDTHKQHISKGKTGKKRGPLTMEHKQNIANSLCGRFISDEHKTKIKAKRKLQIFSEKDKKKMSESHIGNIPGNAKSIQTPTGIFPSVSAAARAFAVSNQTMFNWANSESKIDFYIIASK